MKKNFKKSKFVILPALATLVLTGVASVTGTVTWFTANRAVSVTTGNFTAYDESRGLEIKATAVAGVTIGDNNVVTPSGVLTDASFDFSNVWTDVPNTENEGEAPTEFVKATTPFKSGSKDESSNEVYYAMQWTYTIGLVNKNGELAKSIDVLFDESSSFNVTTTTGTTTANGFRIAMVSGENKFVFSNGNEKKHIGEKTDEATKGEEMTWADADYITATPGYSKLADGVDHKNANEYLGTITNSSDTISIACTAWYEGTDSSVISNNAMSTVGATLKFYSRNAA